MKSKKAQTKLTKPKITSSKQIETIWQDPSHPAGFGGVSKLQEASGESRKKTQRWLSNQLAYSLHKPMRKRFPTRSYKTSGINDLWQMDLLEMIPFAKVNNGYKYILTCIDVFSRFARALPLKTKSANDVADALQIMFKHQKPKHVQTDEGKEFYNAKVGALLKKHGINHYSVYSQYKAAHVERFNRTLRERLTKYTTWIGNKKWVLVLPKIIHAYNNSKHRAIGLKPIEVTDENAMELWLKQNSDKKSKAKYKIGMYVRISKIRGSPFIKNFDQNWSDEVFKISKVDLNQNPVMYVLEDNEGEELKGKFYEPELQVIDEPTVYRIQKILKTKGLGKDKQYYVKWHGYSTPSWIKSTDIV